MNSRSSDPRVFGNSAAMPATPDTQVVFLLFLDAACGQMAAQKEGANLMPRFPSAGGAVPKRSRM